MSWLEWPAIKANPPVHSWRRIASIIALISLTLAVPLWAYAALHEIRNKYSYTFTSAQIGRWSSLLIFVISAFSEKKIRRYLLLGAAGLLFFYAITIGELP
jgi:uncharacterized paraquat-inducible protein A